MHFKRVINKNLRTEHVYITKRSNGKLRLKLGSFYNASVQQFTMVYTSAGNGNTKRFGAPEVTGDNDIERKKFNNRADVYSLGIVLYDICMMAIPEDQDNLEDEHYEEEINCEKAVEDVTERGYSSEITEILKMCLCADPADRPSVLNIITRSEALGKHAREIIHEDKEFEEEYKECQDFKFRCDLPSTWEITMTGEANKELKKLDSFE